MSIMVTRDDPRHTPSCMVCGKPCNVLQPLTFIDERGVIAHVDCWSRWQTNVSAGGARTYWSGPRVTEQIRKITHAPGVVNVLGFRRATNALTDTLEVDVLFSCVEPDGRPNPFVSTIHCAAPTPLAPRGKGAYAAVPDVVAELLEGSPLADRIRRAR